MPNNQTTGIEITINYFNLLNSASLSSPITSFELLSGQLTGDSIADSQITQAHNMMLHEFYQSGYILMELPVSNHSLIYGLTSEGKKLKSFFEQTLNLFLAKR